MTKLPVMIATYDELVYNFNDKKWYIRGNIDDKHKFDFDLGELTIGELMNLVK